jgi:hypothetical protein
MAGLPSYLTYYDINVVPSKFKRKVKMLKAYREDEEALDAFRPSLIVEVLSSLSSLVSS